MAERPAPTKKEQILQAALTLFAENGYPKTHILDIAESCSMGKSTFYDYFKSKEDLLLEIFETKVIAPYEEFTEQLKAPELSCKDKLLMFLRFESKMTDLMGHPKNHMDFLLSQNDLLKKEEVCRAVQRFTTLRFYMIFRILEKGVQSGEFRDIDIFRTTAFIIGAHLFSCCLDFQFPPFPEEYAASLKSMTAKEREEEFMNLILHGLLK
ncbi:MAG: TetR/AcrR family transcriptional regulator [Anaerovoracaceae bacterium]|nr:TetR/AcrR family transcriptional regulator [Anaerovoracaceae bacterium]